ncbi:EAL domain-containing protein [Mycolicibacterium sp. CBM1]
MRSGGVGKHLPKAEQDIPIELVRPLLGILRRRLGADAAWLSVASDDVTALDGDAAVVGLASCAPRVVPVLSRAGVTMGMVCTASREPRPYLGDTDSRFIAQIAELVGALIERDEHSPDTAAARRTDVRDILSQNDFEIVFQSVHDVASGAIVGVEALVRFPRTPFRPDAFLAQAALMGLGVELETAILERAIALVPQLPRNVFVAVNVSPKSALAVPWAELLANVDPSRIVLELTEHDAVLDYGALDAALAPHRAKGVRVAVDDVGAGFSSFSHVLELSPEFVKIDRSITRHIDVDEARRRLAHAVAELAGQIGATVIAEGVENQGELDAIGAVGIRAAQGYFLSRPAPLVHGFTPADVTAAPPDRFSAAVGLTGDRPFELAFTHSPIGMAVVGLDGSFLRTNRALRAMLGYTKQELADRTFQEITHPDDLETDLALLTECLEGRRRSYRIAKRYIAADRSVVWGALTVVSVHARDQPHYFVSQIVDVTADRIREADLVHQAATDPLTGIANRSAGWNRLEELQSSGLGYGILFCDIARFKSVNDQHGHRAGDQLLIEVTNRLLTVVGDEGLVARWGGDEFLVITHAVDDSELARLAGEIKVHLASRPVTLGNGIEVAVRFEIGCAAHRPDDGRSIDAVLDQADRAMYATRRHRRGAPVGDPPSGPAGRHGAGCR